MIGTFNIKLHAANPNLPLPRLFAFVGSPSNVRIVDAPRKIGSWSLTKVYLLANYPDNTSRSVEATLDGGCWHATLPACSVVGVSAVGFRVTADGVSEDGTTSVTGYVLGAGDLEILSTDGTVTVGETTYYAHILDTQPTTPHKGDMCVIDGVWKLYNGSAWISLGGVAEVDWANITNKPSSFTPSSHAATHGSSGTDPITPAAIGAVPSESGDASVAWNSDGNLAVSGGKFVGSFDGEFMAAAWNDYKIDLGGGETADLPEELAAQIGNHNTADDAHSGKFDAAGTAASAVSTHNSSSSAHSSQFSAKADKVSDANDGEVAFLDANGNLTRHSNITYDSSFNGIKFGSGGETSVSDSGIYATSNMPGQREIQLTDSSQSLAIYHKLSEKGNAASFATAYDRESTYSVGAHVSYGGNIYRCKTTISTPEYFDSSKWEKLTLDQLLGMTSGTPNDPYVISLFSSDNTSLTSTINSTIASRCASLDPATSSIADIINALKGN